MQTIELRPNSLWGSGGQADPREARGVAACAGGGGVRPPPGWHIQCGHDHNGHCHGLTVLPHARKIWAREGHPQRCLLSSPRAPGELLPSDRRGRSQSASRKASRELLEIVFFSALLRWRPGSSEARGREPSRRWGRPPCTWRQRAFGRVSCAVVDSAPGASSLAAETDRRRQQGKNNGTSHDGGPWRPQKVTITCGSLGQIDDNLPAPHRGRQGRESARVHAKPSVQFMLYMILNST